MDKNNNTQKGAEFNVHKIKKYFKDQQPPENIDNQFEDDLFPANENSLMSLNENGVPLDPEAYKTCKDGIDPKEISWKRITELFQEFEIFEGKIELDDVKQGSIGNCYFISALAALTEFPNLIMKIFKTKQPSKNGLYEIAFFIDGEWQIVLVDDYIPVYTDGSKPAFAKPNGNEIWVMLLEKAWAKVNGGYINIIGGYATDTLAVMTGFSKRYVAIKEENFDEIWEIVSEADQNNNIMCCATIDTEEAENMGLVGCHAYTLISANSTTVNGDLVRLVQIRNPWGSKEWKGDWSDSSPLWNEKLNKVFGRSEAEDDGLFYMKVEDFCKFFRDLYICYSIYNCNSKSYNMQEEEIQINKPQTFSLNIRSYSDTTITINAPYYRFNRDLKNKEHPISLLLAKVDPDENSLEFIDGDFSTNDDPTINKFLTKGKYLIWFYFNTNVNNERPIDNFFLKISNTSKFVSNYEKEDSDFSIMRQIMLSGIRVSENENIQNNPRWEKKEYPFKSTGIGYYVKFNNTDDIYHMISVNSTNILSMSLVYPTTESKFDLFGTPNSAITIFAIKQSSVEEYFFDVPVDAWTKESPFDEDPDNGAENQFSNSIKLKNLINEEILDEHVEDDYYNFISPSIEDAKSIISLKTIDVKKLKMEEFEKDYPIHMKKLEEIPEVEDYAKNEWNKIVFENGIYLGQVDSNGTRTGRGIYIMEEGYYYTGIYVKNEKHGFFKEYNEDHSLYFEGNYVRGKKNGKGKLISEDGNYYLGEFKNNVRQGHGEYWFISCGQRYVGNYADGKKEGKGCYYYSDNEWWDGTFRDDMWNGTGIYHYASGENEEMTYENDEKV